MCYILSAQVHGWRHYKTDNPERWVLKFHYTMIKTSLCEDYCCRSSSLVVTTHSWSATGTYITLAVLSIYWKNYQSIHIHGIFPIKIAYILFIVIHQILSELWMNLHLPVVLNDSAIPYAGTVYWCQIHTQKSEITMLLPCTMQTRWWMPCGGELRSDGSDGEAVMTSHLFSRWKGGVGLGRFY